jgi:hypothetical protein
MFFHSSYAGRFVTGSRPLTRRIPKQEFRIAANVTRDVQSRGSVHSDCILTVRSAAVGWVDPIMPSGQYQHMAVPPYTRGLEFYGKFLRAAEITVSGIKHHSVNLHDDWKWCRPLFSLDQHHANIDLLIRSGRKDSDPTSTDVRAAFKVVLHRNQL